MYHVFTYTAMGLGRFWTLQQLVSQTGANAYWATTVMLSSHMDKHEC